MSALGYTAIQIRPLVGSVVRQFTANATLVPGDWVYLVNDGDVDKSDSDAAGTSDAIGVVVPSNQKASYAAGEAVSVAVFGPVAGFSSLTPGARGYVSATAGRLDTAAGTVVKAMGYAESAQVFFIMPGVAGLTS